MSILHRQGFMETASDEKLVELAEVAVTNDTGQAPACSDAAPDPESGYYLRKDIRDYS
jgi:hypothetical protein